MSWNLEKHILDHSDQVYNKLNSKRDFNPSDSSNQHFTFSIDFSQMILNHDCLSQKDIDVKMKAFMDDFVKYESINREIKGKTKSGSRKYRDVKFNFQNDVLVAYHNNGSDSINSQNYAVNPHFHVLFHKSVKVGSGYKYLREAINTTAVKHGLVFHNMEKTTAEKTDRKGSSLTWFVKRATDKDFAEAFKSGYLEKQLDAFQAESKQTGNIQYLLKGYADLESRLERQNIKHDLNFNLFLNESQKHTIEAIYRGDKAEIQELVSDRSNHIARAYLEHTLGFNNIIINEIEKRADKVVPIVSLDLNRIAIKTKIKGEKKGDYSKTINNCYKSDLANACNFAKNEKDLKKIMISLGYNDFMFKQKNTAGKRQRVGFSFKNINGKIVIVYFNQIGNSMTNIREQLVSNSKVNELVVPNELHSYLKNYKPPVRSKNNDLFEEIYNFKSSIDLNNFYIEEMPEGHVLFKAKGTLIAEYENKLLIKKSNPEDLQRNVTLLVDMVKAKGWDSDNIVINGSDEFKNAVSLEIAKRKIEELREEVAKNSLKSEEVTTPIETEKKEITPRRRDYV